MRAVFQENSGRFTYVVGEKEYDLGHYIPDRYIRAGDQQVCDGGGWRGNTLAWPGGKIIAWHPAKDQLGRPFSRPEYADLPDADVLAWLAKACGAKAYKSRASFERYYQMTP